jgi:hypothetical protein
MTNSTIKLCNSLTFVQSDTPIAECLECSGLDFDKIRLEVENNPVTLKVANELNEVLSGFKEIISVKQIATAMPVEKFDSIRIYKNG